ncbi:MAG: NAD(P)-dependent oxidoreductase [Candidatus Latescibacteria bacterium]|jgi:phosphoglycerate dehydrogenase-like enzyme|nr:NAD(P)-dependent oxidoreductase [Candidatus Latescibacterota bacterium]
MPVSIVLLSPGAENPSRIQHLVDSLAEMRQPDDPDLHFRHVDADLDEDALVEQCQDATALLVQTRNADLVALARRLPDLRLIQTYTAGTDWLDVQGLADAGITVADNGGANAIAVAEVAIALMLSVLHRLDQQFTSVQAGAWGRQVAGEGSDFMTLEGKHIGLVGLGRIGSRVARRLAGWECDLTFHDIADLDPDYVSETGARRVSFDELLATSDVVSLHTPLNRLTRHLVSDRELSLMQPESILVNTCRGAVVDEAALARALQEGSIMGAGLDVTDPEPIAPDSPLLQMDRVVITPHFAARARQSGVHGMRNILSNLLRVGRGEEPQHIVQPV